MKLNRSKYDLLTLLLLFCVVTAAGYTAAEAQGPPAALGRPEVQTAPASSQTGQNSFTSIVSDSRVDGWFSRAGGARLLIELTPFALAMTLLVLLLIVLTPILLQAGYKRANRGYFKTIAHGR